MGIRVNAIAPGFFSTKQNAALLWNEDGSPTERTGKILAATPMNRFGEPEGKHYKCSNNDNRNNFSIHNHFPFITNIFLYILSYIM